MNEVEFKLTEVNVEALDETLRMALGTRLDGIFWDSETLKVFPSGESFTKSEFETIQGAISSHHPSQESAQQQREKLANQEWTTLRQQAQSALDQIAGDLALLPTANNADTKQIVGRLLQRQATIIRALRWLI